MRYKLSAFTDNGTLAFTGALVHVLIDGKAMRSISIPEEYAQPMREYMERTRDD